MYMITVKFTSTFNLTSLNHKPLKLLIISRNNFNLTPAFLNIITISANSTYMFKFISLFHRKILSQTEEKNSFVIYSTSLKQIFSN